VSLLIIVITSGQVATLPVCLIFVIVSACNLHFRPFGPQRVLRPRFLPAASIFGLSGLISACGLDTQHCSATQRYTTLHRL